MLNPFGFAMLGSAALWASHRNAQRLAGNLKNTEVTNLNRMKYVNAQYREMRMPDPVAREVSKPVLVASDSHRIAQAHGFVKTKEFLREWERQTRRHVNTPHRSLDKSLYRPLSVYGNSVTYA